MKLKLIALALLSTTSIAFAADPAARTYTKASVVAEPAINWTGFYIGAMGGYNWSGAANTAGFTIQNGDFEGAFGGGTIGYNWQSSPLWMFGLEVDAAGGDIKYVPKGTLNPPPGALVFGAQEKINAFGSVTGRVGYTVDAALLYAKGGFAWMSNKFAITNGVTVLSETKLQTGYTIGAGLEYMFAPSWSAKVEYMYADFGRREYFSIPGFELGANLHTVKGGINYHFNWGGPAIAPAVAK